MVPVVRTMMMVPVVQTTTRMVSCGATRIVQWSGDKANVRVPPLLRGAHLGLVHSGESLWLRKWVAASFTGLQWVRGRNES
jgi:hypothetical protein